MKRLVFESKVGIFLDHRLLINQSTEEHTPRNALSYELKAELFAFHPNVATTTTPDTDITHYNRRQRKRKATAEPTLCEEFKQLQHQVDGFLRQLTAPSTSAEHQEQQLERYWEEVGHSDFPTFHGANNTADFQTFECNKHTYIIPPRCHFYNYNVLELVKLLPQLADAYDLIVLDPPWRNKYIRRLKRTRHQLAYPMLADEQLRDLPIARLIHTRTLVAIWCTNSAQHQDALLAQFLPAWNLRLLHSLKWLKLNTAQQLISPLSAVVGHKQPYECLYIAGHRESSADVATSLKDVALLCSVPSIVHSHKPPLLAWLQPLLRDAEQPKCLELFARYLQPHHTAVGLEVLKLMDQRLYDCRCP